MKLYIQYILYSFEDRDVRTDVKTMEYGMERR